LIEWPATSWHELAAWDFQPPLAKDFNNLITAFEGAKLTEQRTFIGGVREVLIPVG
jgi:hypothetical protein